MKAPDVIYVEFSEDVNLACEKQPFEETPTYIRKDALLGWANNWLSFERSGIGLDKGFAHAMKIMIDKLNSM